MDVGEIPSPNGTGNEDATDPERLTRIVARIVARSAERFPFTRKLSRHLEGQDKRSGILSDIAAAAIELYRRNPEAVENLGKQAAQDFKQRRMQRAAAKETPNHNGGMTYASR